MSPEEIFRRMYEQDAFSRWMGIELVDIGVGSCAVQMLVRAEMLNGLGLAHGGISFSLADSAFAFACNSQGRVAVSMHCTVEHVAPVVEGDRLVAVATEEHLGQSVSNYAVRVTKAGGQPVAFFRGIAYRKRQIWA